MYSYKHSIFSSPTDEIVPNSPLEQCKLMISDIPVRNNRKGLILRIEQAMSVAYLNQSSDFRMLLLIIMSDQTEICWCTIMRKPRRNCCCQWYNNIQRFFQKLAVHLTSKPSQQKYDFNQTITCNANPNVQRQLST